MNDKNVMPSLGLTLTSATRDEDLLAYLMTSNYCHLVIPACAQLESRVGNALHRCVTAGKKREDFYITTHAPTDSAQNIELSLHATLKRLHLGHVNMYIYENSPGDQSQNEFYSLW